MSTLKINVLKLEKYAKVLEFGRYEFVFQPNVQLVLCVASSSLLLSTLVLTKEPGHSPGRCPGSPGLGSAQIDDSQHSNFIHECKHFQPNPAAPSIVSVNDRRVDVTPQVSSNSSRLVGSQKSNSHLHMKLIHRIQQPGEQSKQGIWWCDEAWIGGGDWNAERANGHPSSKTRARTLVQLCRNDASLGFSEYMPS